jgi:ADP-ribose pyrophosphatase YjhB (NUDIX family)
VPVALLGVAHRLALAVFKRLPPVLRRLAVRLITPQYTVGAVCVLRRGDDVLLLRQRHDPTDWSLPGGLLKRGETPREGLARELREELGLTVPLEDATVRTVVATRERRVDLVYEVRVEQAPDLRIDDLEVREASWRPIAEPVENGVTTAILAAVRGVPLER